MVVVVRGTRAVLLAASLACAAGCGKAGDSDPVARMTEALGGRAAIGRLESLSAAADCAGPGGHFRTWVESLRPGSVHFRQSDGTDSVAVWSTPDSTWLSNGGDVVAGDERVRAFVRGHEFHMQLFEAETRFSGHAVAGSDTVDGHTCTLVTMKDEAGDPAVLLLDQKTALPRMLELNPPGAAGPVRVYFDDWRRVGNLVCFFSFRMTEGPGRTFSYRYTEIIPNRVAAATFATREFR